MNEGCVEACALSLCPRTHGSEVQGPLSPLWHFAELAPRAPLSTPFDEAAPAGFGGLLRAMCEGHSCEEAHLANGENESPRDSL